jgi:hypothetical protein
MSTRKQVVACAVRLEKYFAILTFSSFRALRSLAWGVALPVVRRNRSQTGLSEVSSGEQPTCKEPDSGSFEQNS